MRLSAALIAVSVVLFPWVRADASGAVGVYAVVEKVVFEPNESAAERVQVWGAFAYVEIGDKSGSLGTSSARRGHVHFKLPALVPGFNESTIDAVRREWRDLKAVAGTGQAVAFGRWGYFGPLDGFDLVRAPSQPPAAPTTYRTDVGIVKLTESSHAEVIMRLRDALKK
jgi:hypothetical protein